MAIKFTRTVSDYKPIELPLGSYDAVCTKVSSQEVNIWVKNVKTDDMEPGIRFSFLVNDSEEINIDVSCKLNPKSNLYKRVVGMGGNAATEEVLADDNKLSKLIKSFEGKHYIMTIINGENGKPRAGSVSLYPKGAKPTKAALETVSVEDDETPQYSPKADPDDIDF